MTWQRPWPPRSGRAPEEGFAARFAPLGVGNASQLEQVAVARIHVAAQAADGTQRREVDVERRRIDNAVARIDADHLTDHELVLRPEGQADETAAFESGRRVGEPRRLYQPRGGEAQFGDLRLAHIGGEFGRRDVHGPAIRSSTRLTTNSPKSWILRVLGPSVLVVLQPEHDQCRVLG